MKRAGKGMKLLLIFVLFYPLLFLLAGSLTGEMEISGWVLFPQYPTAVSYVELLFDIPEFYVLFWNSVSYVICIIAGQLAIAVPAAWALTNIRPVLRKVIIVADIAVAVLPFQVRMLPEYLVLKDLNLLNCPAGIILPEVFSALPVLIMYYSFSNQPKALKYSARVDGATEFQVFYKVSLPVAVPAIATCVILALLEYWNMIEQPLMFIKNKSYWPLALFSPGDAEYGMGVVFAMAFFLSVFVLLIFMLLQKYFEEGLSTISKE